MAFLLFSSSLHTGARSKCNGDWAKSMAGAEGFEPPITGPKPVALPLGHAPIRNVKLFIYYSSSIDEN